MDGRHEASDSRPPGSLHQRKLVAGRDTRNGAKKLPARSLQICGQFPRWRLFLLVSILKIPPRTASAIRICSILPSGAVFTVRQLPRVEMYVVYIPRSMIVPSVFCSYLLETIVTPLILFDPFVCRA